MKFKFFFILAIVLSSQIAFAKVEVAFFEIRARDGSVLELEKGGRFGHVAIRIEGEWLHAHPLRGVELVTDISDMGVIKEVLVDDNATLTYRDVRNFVGLAYDFRWRWGDEQSSYCSKLVANILDVAPTPMRFDGEYWARFKTLPRGEPGVSPDGLYEELKERGYSVVETGL